MAAMLPGRSGGQRGRYRPLAEINVTPLVDVMLVLLIIFMVTAPLATVSIRIDIPPATKPTSPTKPPTYLSIDSKGELFVSFSTSPTSTEMRPATLDDMAGLIASSLGVPNPTNEQVFIRADQHVKYGVFMAVVNKLQLDGYYKIGLISEEVQD